MTPLRPKCFRCSAPAGRSRRSRRGLHGFDLEDAYRVTAKVRALREKPAKSRAAARSASPTAPSGPSTACTRRSGAISTIAPCMISPTSAATFSLAGLAEPRIEPEIVFGLTAAPQPGHGRPDKLLGCIDWVAQGYEIVQSVYPDWRFAPADTVAAFGMHGALLIGPRRPLRGGEQAWASSLSSLRDRSLSRRRTHRPWRRPATCWTDRCSRCAIWSRCWPRTPQPAVAAGEIVTTGTLTQAPHIRAGEDWSTRLTGVALDGTSVRFT